MAKVLGQPEKTRLCHRSQTSLSEQDPKQRGEASSNKRGRASPGVAQAPKPFSNLCLRCGGLTLPGAGQEAAGGEQHICCSKSCATCSQTIEDGDLVCQVCGQGQHLAADTACSGVPAGRGPMSFKRGPPSPWLTSQPHGGHKDCHNQIFRVRPHQASRQSSGGCHAVLLK